MRVLRFDPLEDGSDPRTVVGGAIGPLHARETAVLARGRAVVIVDEDRDIEGSLQLQSEPHAFAVGAPAVAVGEEHGRALQGGGIDRVRVEGGHLNGGATRQSGLEV